MELIDKFTRGMRIARVIRGLDQKEASRKAGLADAMWNRFESGKQGYNPTLNTLNSISWALGLSIEELLALPEKADALMPVIVTGTGRRIETEAAMIAVANNRFDGTLGEDYSLSDVAEQGAIELLNLQKSKETT